MKKWNRQQPVTREPGSSAFLEYLAALERDVAAGGGGGGATNLGYTASTRALTSSTGTGVTLPLVGADPGLMSAADKTKLDGIAAGATANATDAALRDRATHTGTQAASTISDFSEAVDDRVAALLVAGANITLTYNDAGNALTIAASGGSGLSGQATVTVPNNRLEHSETVTATGVTGSSRIFLTVAPHDDADENDAEMLDIAAMSAAPGTNQITVEMAFTTPMAGPIKLNWMAA